MNETFDTKDMNISLNAFGSAPIKAEGQEVAYDEWEESEQDVQDFGHVEFNADDAVEVEDEST